MDYFAGYSTAVSCYPAGWNCVELVLGGHIVGILLVRIMKRNFNSRSERKPRKGHYLMVFVYIALLLCLSDSLGSHFFKSFTPLLVAVIRGFFGLSSCHKSAVSRQRFFSLYEEP